MDTSKISYTIGIKRKALPLYKKFKVVAHSVDKDAQPSRLVLTCTDGSLIMVPRIHLDQWRVYPDFIPAQANLKKIKEDKQNGELRG